MRPILIVLLLLLAVVGTRAYGGSEDPSSDEVIRIAAGETAPTAPPQLLTVDAEEVDAEPSPSPTPDAPRTPDDPATPAPTARLSSTTSEEHQHQHHHHPDPTPAPTRAPTPAPTPEPTPEPTPDPTPEPTPEPQNSYSKSEVKRQIRQTWEGDDDEAIAVVDCETGGTFDPTMHGGPDDQYHGLWQFTLGTYQRYGGSGDPHDDSPAEQTRAAWNLYSERGWDPWPACGPS